MKALVATSNHLLLVDFDTAAVRNIESHRPEYYGISWHLNGEYPVLGHSVIDSRKLTSIASYADSQKGYLSMGDTRSPAFLSNPHQILCAPNGWIVTANTGRNRITLYDPSDQSFRDIKTSEANWDRNEDDLCGDHINSIFIKDDRLYVLAHGYYRNSYVLEFSFPDCRVIDRHDAKNRSGLHNIWVDHHGAMLSCHSGSGELIDVQSNKVLWAGYASYARGMAVSADYLFIGDTEFREHNDSSDRCGIWIIKRDSFRTMQYVPLGDYGSCREIRLLDVPDEAHHGKIFTNMDWLRRQEATPAHGNTGMHLDEFLVYKRKRNLQQRAASQNQDFMRHMDFVSGRMDVNESGWITPRPDITSDHNAAAISKKVHLGSMKLSLDYMFLHSEDLSMQDISVLVGYDRGKKRNLAICLRYTGKNSCDVYLGEKDGVDWKMTELLMTGVVSVGKLEITKLANSLKITINGSFPVERVLSVEDATGHIGVHCQGSYFRNFNITEL